MVTMKDVAKAAGVSQAAVSYAYSNSPKISPQVRERIYATAADLGYTGPNIVGASLRSGRVGAVGVMVMDSLVFALDDPSTTMLMKGIVEVGELADVALTLLPVDRPGVKSPGQTPALRGLVDGVVLHNISENHPILPALIERELPAVVIDSPRRAGLPFVGINDRKAGLSQMAHILELGHRRIAVIVDRFHPNSPRQIVSIDRVKQASERVVRDRVLGYLDACRETGLPLEDLVLVEAGGIDADSARRATRDLLDSRSVTAIVGTSDVIAAAAVEVLRECGLAVPQDVSVIGFDDAPVAEIVGLSTIRQPLVEKGRTAARILLDRMSGGTRSRSIMPTELVLRDTTARAPNRG
jgi:DNA-binding LacI/PurR family transcriptional regulator